MGKILIITGIIIMVAGIIVSLVQPGGFPKLPGDIYIQRDNFTFYFPLGWCILISIVASVIFWLIGK